MEKTLTRNQIIAIEKLRKTQNRGKGKSDNRKSNNKTKSSATHSDKAAQPQKIYFPVTEPTFQGISRPAEAREKSARLIELLEKFNNRAAKKVAKPIRKNKIRPVFFFFPLNKPKTQQ